MIFVRIPVALVVATGLLVANSGLASAASCSAIKAHYFRSVKPAMAHIAIRNPTIAFQFKQRLSQLQRGTNPTRAELDAAYRLLVKDCATKGDAADCRAVAERLHSASHAVYSQHRQWALAKCEGRLTTPSKS